MIEISAVPPEELANVWLDCKKWLKGATDTAVGKFHVDDIYTGSQNGTYVVWIVIDSDLPLDDQIIGAFTSRIISYPNRLAMAVDWLGGTRMSEWIDLGNDMMHKYAKEMGCKHLEIYGRKAWGRVLGGKRGFKPAYIVYEAQING